MKSERRNTVKKEERSQSETVGLVLILAVTILAVGAIYATGIPSLNSAQQNAQVERVTNEFALLDSKATSVALGQSGNKIVRMNTGGGNLYIQKDKGWINFSYNNQTTGKTVRLYNRSMGRVIYTNNKDKVAYQGGGVWRKSRDGDPVMISPPEFAFRDRTLTFPLIRITSQGGGSGSAETNKLRVNSSISAREVYPDPSKNRLNPLKDGPIFVELKSEFCEAWRNYFVQETSANVVSDCGKDDRVRLELEIPPDPIEINNAIVSQDGGKNLELGQKTGADSYNSSKGGYPGYTPTGSIPFPNNETGNISLAGKLIVRNTADVYGNVFSSKSASDSVCVENKGRIWHNVTTEGQVSDAGKCDSSQVFGNIEENVNVDIPAYSAPENDAVIESKVNRFRNDNDNSKASCIDDTTNELDIGSSCTLTQGDYYIEESDPELQKDNLILDTSTGKIEIVVDGSGTFSISNSGIQVNGGSKATFYINQTTDIEQNTIIETDSSQTAEKMFVRLHSRGDISITQGNTKVTGVVYAPGSKVSMSQGAQVFGAVIGNDVELGQGARVHFDEALRSQNVKIQGLVIAYLHITENAVDIDN